MSSLESAFVREFYSHPSYSLRASHLPDNPKTRIGEISLTLKEKKFKKAASLISHLPCGDLSFINVINQHRETAWLEHRNNTINFCSRVQYFMEESPKYAKLLKGLLLGTINLCHALTIAKKEKIYLDKIKCKKIPFFLMLRGLC